MQWPTPAGAAWEEEEPRPELKLSRNHSLGESRVRALLCSTNHSVNFGMFLREDLTGICSCKYAQASILPNHTQTPQMRPLNIPTNQSGKPNKFTGMPSVNKFLEFEIILQTDTYHLIAELCVHSCRDAH